MYTDMSRNKAKLINIYLSKLINIYLSKLKKDWQTNSKQIRRIICITHFYNTGSH